MNSYTPDPWRGSTLIKDAGQKYTVKLHPAGKLYVGFLNVHRDYRYLGHCPTLQAASVEARKRIHAMNRETIQWNEKHWTTIND